MQILRAATGWDVSDYEAGNTTGFERRQSIGGGHNPESTRVAIEIIHLKSPFHGQPVHWCNHSAWVGLA